LAMAAQVTTSFWFGPMILRQTCDMNVTESLVSEAHTRRCQGHPSTWHKEPQRCQHIRRCPAYRPTTEFGFGLMSSDACHLSVRRNPRDQRPAGSTTSSTTLSKQNGENDCTAQRGGRSTYSKVLFGGCFIKHGIQVA